MKILGGTTTFQLTVSIATGWNLVSIPGLHPADQNVNTWWPYRDVAASVFKYTAGYIPVTSAFPGTGYWMKHSGSRIYNTGDEWPARGINIIEHNPIQGAAGWNLIGGYEESVPASGITTTPPGLITGSVYKYSGGYISAASIDPGYAYWVKLTGSGQINIPSGNDAGRSGDPEIFRESSNFAKIIITDASQKLYTLYAVTGETGSSSGVDLNKFDLPPYPPQGIFDIRYSSQRYAERINITPQAVEMMGVQYPVKVKAEGTGLILSNETGKEIARLKDGEEASVTSPGKLFVSENVIPAFYALEQNYPNPFNPGTTIQFSISEDVKNVKLIIYTALGEKVTELVNKELEAGTYKYSWDASGFSSGIYFYKIVAGKFISTRKMILIK
jgi:hypothetical protein